MNRGATFITGTVCDNKIYTVLVEYDWLVEYDMDNGSYKCLADLNELYGYAMWVVQSVIYKDNKLYLILINNCVVIEYDLLNDSICKYGEIDTLEYSMRNFNAHLIGDKIIVTPWKLEGNNIWVYDITKKEITKLLNIFTYFDLCDIDENIIYATESIRIEENIYIPIWKTPYVCVMSVTDWNCELVKLDKNLQISSMSTSEDKVYLTGCNSSTLWSWDIKNNLVSEICSLNKMKVFENTIRGVVNYNNKLYVIPRLKQEIFVYDEKTKTTEMLKYPDEYKVLRKEEEYWIFYDYVVIDKCILLYPGSHNGVLVLDMDKGTMAVYKLTLTKKDKVRYCKNMLNVQGCLYEGLLLDINEYVDIIDELVE